MTKRAQTVRDDSSPMGNFKLRDFHLKQFYPAILVLCQFLKSKPLLPTKQRDVMLELKKFEKS